ncbi:unnamed protein product [Ranitomeya imitator]|uniref:BDHCT domain-containing protein n=1 Tax=Ranitomeya imitator TaxID=111125 RepID=A0ABN9L728_9NEOB|nr:unnamed protein product [Ranitomeya imitator]
MPRVTHSVTAAINSVCPHLFHRSCANTNPGTGTCRGLQGLPRKDDSAKVTVDAVCDDDIDADDLAEVILPEDEYDEDFIPPSPMIAVYPPRRRSGVSGQEVSPELYAVMLDICKLVDRIPTTELLFLSCRKELQKQMDIWKRLSSNDSVLKSSLVEPRCLSSGSKPSDSKIDSAPGFLGTLVSDASVQRPLGECFLDSPRLLLTSQSQKTLLRIVEI